MNRNKLIIDNKNVNYVNMDNSVKSPAFWSPPGKWNKFLFQVDSYVSIYLIQRYIFVIKTCNKNVAYLLLKIVCSPRSSFFERKTWRILHETTFRWKWLNNAIPFVEKTKWVRSHLISRQLFRNFPLKTEKQHFVLFMSKT